MFVCDESNELSSLEKHVSGSVIILLNVGCGFEMGVFPVVKYLLIWLQSCIGWNSNKTKVYRKLESCLSSIVGFFNLLLSVLLFVVNGLV